MLSALLIRMRNAAMVASVPFMGTELAFAQVPLPPIERAPPGIERNKPDPRLKCVCSERTESISFSGITVDAELSANPDGRSVVGAQTTIFEVTRSPAHPRGTRLKVSHPTLPDPCGVSFNYGVRYDVVARANGDALETDYCLIPQPAPETRGGDRRDDVGREGGA